VDVKILRLWFPLVLAFVLSACSGGSTGPTEAQARAMLEEDIQKFSQGCIQLLEFKKTEEKQMDSLMSVSATVRIEFLQDCVWPNERLVVVSKLVPGVSPNVRKGDQRIVSLDFLFEKADGGWKPVRPKDATSAPTR
jgi:hypothetical protein